jgi:hypothetical protein
MAAAFLRRKAYHKDTFCIFHAYLVISNTTIFLPLNQEVQQVISCHTVTFILKMYRQTITEIILIYCSAKNVHKLCTYMKFILRNKFRHAASLTHML